MKNYNKWNRSVKPKIWLTADLHFGHKNILKYAPRRKEKLYAWAKAHNKIVTDENIVSIMDEWLIDLWNSTVSKIDNVYILGDFSFKSAEENRKLLDKLNGNKFLVLGNHDGNSDTLHDKFKYIKSMAELKLRDYQSGEDTVCLEMSHFPMRSWNRMEHGTIQVHGHCHNSMPKKNYKLGELRVDVGIDSDLANYHFVSPEMIVNYFNNITKGRTYREYARYIISRNLLQRGIIWIKNSIKYKRITRKLK